jgi:hypothetical protein
MTDPKHSHRCMILAFKRHPDQFQDRPACDCGADALIEAAVAQLSIGYLEATAADAEREGYVVLARASRDAAELLRDRHQQNPKRDVLRRSHDAAHRNLGKVRARIAALEQVLRANLRDFELINRSKLWTGHPFNDAVKQIRDALAPEA